MKPLPLTKEKMLYSPDGIPCFTKDAIESAVEYFEDLIYLSASTDPRIIKNFKEKAFAALYDEYCKSCWRDKKFCVCKKEQPIIECTKEKPCKQCVWANKLEQMGITDVPSKEPIRGYEKDYSGIDMGYEGEDKTTYPSKQTQDECTHNDFKPTPYLCVKCGYSHGCHEDSKCLEQTQDGEESEE